MMKNVVMAPLRSVIGCGLVAGIAVSIVLLAMPSCGADREPVDSKAERQEAPEKEPLAAERIHLTDITAQSGIDMSITCGKLPSTEILEVNGGGLALIDYDNDHDLDLFVANGATLDAPENGPGSRLYQNIGEFRFRDVTAESGIDLRRWAMGVAVGDFDGDRLDDLFISCYGPNVLLRNAGNGQFVDVTSSAGLADSPLRNWSTSAAFGDIDNDGDLDLYVCNYLDFDIANPPARTRYKGVEVMAGPHGLTPQHDRLYENQGDGTFRDITELSGCMARKSAFGLNVVILDFDNDGRQDIVVANDSMPGFYFHNRGTTDGHTRLDEIGTISGIASNIDGANQAAMGLAIADVDGNGLADKFTTVFSSDTNSLHMNSLSPGGQFFEDRSQQHGLAMISRPYLGWSCGFYDFDHDGDEDLFYVNGHVYPEATMEAMDSDYQQPPFLFERAGKRFKRVMSETAGPWLAEKHRDRNAVFADFDADGDIDIIIGELNGPIRVLRSDLIGAARSPRVAAATNWLIVELNDERAGAKNHRALGSRIDLSARDDTGQAVKQIRWMFTGGGFQSSGAHYVHFGLPKSAGDIALTVTWPDGFKQEVAGVQSRSHLVIKRGDRSR